MFNIDDQFLASVGYDVASLSEAQKQQYAKEIEEEINERLSVRLLSELTDEQVDEFNDIQENRERTYRWLNEFHTDYESRPEYRAVLEAEGDQDRAATMYATAMWMNDAIPDYAKLAEDEFKSYHQLLIKMRQSANEANDGDTPYGA